MESSRARGRPAVLFLFCLVPAAASAAPPMYWRNEARLELARTAGNSLALEYRYYLTEVCDQPEPYRLHPFLQRAGFAEVRLSSGPGVQGLLEGEGLIFFSEDVPVGAIVGLGFGSYGGLGQSVLRLGARGYFKDDLAAEGWFERRNQAGVPSTELTLGARFITEVAEGTLDLWGGLRSTSGVGGGAGLVIDASYFFDKSTHAGLTFSTDRNELILSGGILMETGFLGELSWSIGQSLSLRAGMRF